MNSEAQNPRVLVLVATIPTRKQPCTRVLGDLMQQTRRPDGVVLVLDGYGDESAPPCPFPVVLEKRTPQLSGAGNRWRALAEIPADDIVICIDDDMIFWEAPNLVEELAKAVVEFGGAAAPMGRTFDGKAAPPGAWSRGDLLHAAGHGISARAGVLAGVIAFAEEVKASGGPDALGPHGDDDALVSAYLWKTGVPIKHVATGNQHTQWGIKSTFKPQADPNIQKRAIAKATGWPWKTYDLFLR